MDVDGRRKQELAQRRRAVAAEQDSALLPAGRANGPSPRRGAPGLIQYHAARLPSQFACGPPPVARAAARRWRGGAGRYTLPVSLHLVGEAKAARVSRPHRTHAVDGRAAEARPTAAAADGPTAKAAVGPGISRSRSRSRKPPPTRSPKQKRKPSKQQKRKPPQQWLKKPKKQQQPKPKPQQEPKPQQLQSASGGCCEGPGGCKSASRSGCKGPSRSGKSPSGSSSPEPEPLLHVWHLGCIFSCRTPQLTRSTPPTR